MMKDKKTLKDKEKTEMWKIALVLLPIFTGFFILFGTFLNSVDATNEASHKTENKTIHSEQVSTEPTWSKAKRYKMKIGGYLENKEVHQIDRLVFSGFPSADVLAFTYMYSPNTKYSYTLPLYLPTNKDFQITIPELNWRITVISVDRTKKTIQIDVEKLQTNKN